MSLKKYSAIFVHNQMPLYFISPDKIVSALY